MRAVLKQMLMRTLRWCRIYSVREGYRIAVSAISVAHANNPPRRNLGCVGQQVLQGEQLQQRRL